MGKRFSICALLAASSVVCLGTGSSQAAVSAQTSQPVAGAQHVFYPPWSHGENNPAPFKGMEITVPEVDNLPDFHGSLDHPQLVLYVAGNYYFAMAPLVAAFEKIHPALKGKIYYETIPPGLLEKQMRAHGTVTVGNMTWTIEPDVFAGGQKKVAQMVKAGLLEGPGITYATNNLTIMVPKGNPAHIHSLRDLGRPGVRLVMPNPAWEGVARQIKASLQKAGGKALVHRIYETKVANGETLLTQIHHRQTPLFLMQGRADAGITWRSEAIFQEQVGHPISDVPIASQLNTTAIYGAAVVKGASHPEAARAWLDFLQTPVALRIFERYGFKAVHARQ